MKLLLDENLPTKLRNFFSNNHTVSTVADENWHGTKNGELLKLMSSKGFRGLVTLDKNLEYQQNLKKSGIRIFILNAPNSKLKTLKPYIMELENCIANFEDENVIRIDLK